MAGRKLMKEQEALEDAPGNGKYKSSKLLHGASNTNENEPQLLEKQSTFSRISKNMFNYSISTNQDPSSNGGSSSGYFSRGNTPKGSNGRGYHRSNSRSAPLKIEELFDTHFTRNMDEIYALLDPSRSPTSPSSRGRNNISETLTMETLKTILKTVLEEIESLKQKCMAVENRYKEATITASRELQESMNILFKLQQKTATLEDSSKAVDRLSHDLKVIKVRLAEKEKECRWLTSETQSKDNKITEQANEIKELAALVGGNSLDLAKQAEEARRANLLSEEVKDLSLKIKQLRAENGTLRSRIDEWNQSQKAPAPPDPSQGTDSSSSSDKEKKDLMDALVSKDEEMSQLRQEISKLRDALLSVQATGDMSAALEMEREMRYEAERKAEKERNDRLAAESEWNALSEQVVDDMENSRRQYEKLSDSKAELEKELEVYRVSRSNNSGSHEVENKLVESKYELRKAQNTILDLKGETSYHIRVFFCIKGAATSKSNTKGGGPSAETPFVRISSDGISIRVTESLFRGATTGVLDSNAADNTKKYMCDRVFNRSDPEHGLILASSVDEYIQFAMEGHQSSVISYGKTSPDRSQLLFGTTDDVTTGLTFRSLHLFVGRFQSMESDGWSFTLHTSFVRIFEDSIMDMFGNDLNATHEVQKNEGGSIAITNVNMLTTNWRDRDYLSTLSSRVCQTYAQQMNSEEGSRLHFVLTFHISGTHSAKENVVEGQFSLVHVSGAENMSKLRSMQCFAELFPSIAKRQPHIPYRNSKLTYLLQPSLSPSGRSIMIFSFDGADPNAYDNTMSSLQLANQALDCTIAPTSTAATSASRISKHDSRKSKIGSSRPPPKMKLNLL